MHVTKGRITRDKGEWVTVVIKGHPSFSVTLYGKKRMKEAQTPLGKSRDNQAAVPLVLREEIYESYLLFVLRLFFFK